MQVWIVTSGDTESKAIRYVAATRTGAMRYAEAAATDELPGAERTEHRDGPCLWTLDDRYVQVWSWTVAE